MAFQKPKRATNEIWIVDVPRWGGRLLALVTLHFGTTHTRMSQDWRHFKELFVANKHSGGIPLHVARRPPEWLQNIRCLPVSVWTWPSRSGITTFYTLHSAEKTTMLRQQTATCDAAVDMTIDALKELTTKLLGELAQDNMQLLWNGGVLSFMREEVVLHSPDVDGNRSNNCGKIGEEAR